MSGDNKLVVTKLLYISGYMFFVLLSVHVGIHPTLNVVEFYLNLI